MRTKTVKIEELSQDPANVRRHPERNLEAIKASLRRFGQQRPIVVDKAGVVRAGNGTLEAARLLGWESIQVLYTDLSGSEATAYAIADNRTSELAEWDNVALATTLQALQGEGLALEELGWNSDELAALLREEQGPPSEFPEYDEDIPTEHQCPNCGFKWSGLSYVVAT